MNEVTIEGVDDLYNRLSTASVDLQTHGPVAQFYVKAKTLKDPNVCSCKKGRRAQDELLRLYMGLPAQMRNEPLRSMVKSMLGGDVFVFKANGVEFARLG